jgi:RNA polymerase sigma factor (sigma-70 family)
MIPDRALLQRYAQDASEEAFAEIVRRHIGLVYGTALRQLCGNATLARDVTQAVFTALAAKAAESAGIAHLAGWLHGTTRFTVSHTVRAERRRQEREQQAHSMQALLTDSGPDALGAVPPPLFDEVLETLDAPDREAVLRRFFAGESFATIGTALGASEDAARMRVSRALEKIRAQFAKRGIYSSAAALSAALAGQAVAAPDHLAAGIAAAALSGAAAFVAPAGVKLGLAAFMSTIKTSTWVGAAAILSLLGYSGYQYREAARHDEEALQWTLERARLTADLARSERHNGDLTRRAALADQQAAELQGKLIAALAPNPYPPPVMPPRPAADPNRLQAEKLAQLKPLLESGLPITGAVSLQVAGQPSQRQVAFVMGQETRIELGSDGTYVVTPSLNRDGTVVYRCALVKKDTVSGEEKIVSTPAVTTIPWLPFKLVVGDMSFGFEPDKIEP